MLDFVTYRQSPAKSEHFSPRDKKIDLGNFMADSVLEANRQKSQGPLPTVWIVCCRIVFKNKFSGAYLHTVYFCENWENIFTLRVAIMISWSVPRILGYERYVSLCLPFVLEIFIAVCPWDMKRTRTICLYKPRYFARRAQVTGFNFELEGKKYFETWSAL